MPDKHQIPKKIPFSISSRTIRMLGRENVSSSIIALTELIKNGYDADAETVTVTLKNASQQKGQIIIKDDGEGMDFNQLKNNWMVVGTDVKEREPSTDSGRVKVGKKGIGRLALDRLSDHVIIETFKKEATYGLRLRIDWTRYNNPKTPFHTIEHPLEKIEKKKIKGTDLYLTGLHDIWTYANYENLKNDLMLLVPPFDPAIKDFQIDLQIDEAPGLSGSITSLLGAIAEYKLESTLYENRIHHILTHKDGTVTEDNRPWQEAFSDANNEYVPKCGNLRFKILFYLREAKQYKDLDIKFSEVKNFLNAYQGIRIYRDNFRVKPYGEPGGEQDWLGLNLRRIRSPDEVTASIGRWKVGENQLIGTIFITKEDNPNLEDKTNREGFIENQAFYDLKKFVLHGIQFFERERQTREREKKPKEEIDIKKEIKISKEKLEKQSTRRREEDNTEDAEEIEEITQKLTKIEDELEELQTEQQLMRGLATLGIAMAAFGHETSAAINQIANRIEPMKEIGSILTEGDRTDFYEHINNIDYNVGLIASWGQFALNHVKKDKRTQRRLDMNKIIEDTFSYFKGSFDKRGIESYPNLNPRLPKIRAFSMDIEAIIINLITNAIDALEPTPIEKRRIEVITDYDNTTKEFKLIFRDSGKGIRGEDLERIYDPLYSTKVDRKGNPLGTGLGLTIVNKIVQEYNGSINAISSSVLGGAEFSIVLPKRSGEVTV